MKHMAVFDILCYERLPGMKHVAVFHYLTHGHETCGSISLFDTRDKRLPGTEIKAK